MKKTVILDGKKRYKNQYETINIILSKQTIIGVGYLPDDEDCDKINAKNHLIVANITNLNSLFKNKIDSERNNGISNRTPSYWNIETESIPKQKTDFIIHPNLAYDENIERINNIYDNTKKAIISNVQFSEMNYIIETYKKLETKLHLILNHCDELTLNTIKKTPYKHITFGILYHQNLANYIPLINQLITEKKITSISSTDNDSLLHSLHNISKKHLPDLLYDLFDKNFEEVFHIKNKNFSMLSKPNLSIINIPQNETEEISILATIIKGNIIQ